MNSTAYSARFFRGSAAPAGCIPAGRNRLRQEYTRPERTAGGVYPTKGAHLMQRHIDTLNTYFKMKGFLLLIFSLLWVPLCLAHEEGEFIASDMLAGMQPGDKAALLMVHFGTTHDDTRALTIDAVNRKAKETFPQLECREAYTSRMIIRRLKARGIEKLNPADALARLKADGFTHVLIQSTNIIDGIEMESLRKDIAAAVAGFKEIRVGNPLLYTPADYAAVIDALTPDSLPGGATVLVGHGTYTPATAQYAMMDYMLSAQGFPRFHVATIEGYPTFDTLEAKLKAAGTREVRLMPFLFVAGDHAKNDIAVDWKEALEKKGYQVDMRMKGLGENPAIRQLFIEHARYMLTHKKVDILDKKKAYAAGKE